MSFLRRQFVLVLVAVQFLTRLPTPTFRGFDPTWPVRAARFYPLVGHGVGLICAAVWLGASQLWPAPVAATLAILAGALVTGGFHEDGLADTADGLGGGQTREQRLTIMKDSRIGTYGALALLGVGALRITALSGLSPWRGALALIVAHGAARAFAVIVMTSTPYVGDVGTAKGRVAGARTTVAEAAFAAAWGLCPLILLGFAHGVAALALATAATLALAITARRLIGGHTGDVLGATEQLCEAALLLGIALALSAAWA